MQAHYHELYHTFESERKVNTSDELADAEIAWCRAERDKANGMHPLPVRFCDCPETLINGKRVPCPPWHSCEYTKARSALVVEATRITSQKMGAQRCKDPIAAVPRAAAVGGYNPEMVRGARGVALVGADIGSSVPIRVSKTPAQSKFGVQNKGIS